MELKFWFDCSIRLPPLLALFHLENFSRNRRTFLGTQKHYLEQRSLELVSNLGSWAAPPATSLDLFFPQARFVPVFYNKLDTCNLLIENRQLFCSALPDYHVTCPPLVHQRGQRAVLEHGISDLFCDTGAVADLKASGPNLTLMNVD